MRKFFVLIVISLFAFNGIYTSKVEAVGFTDVPTHHRFYEDVQYLINNGVITPSGSKFGIDEEITREEVAIMISKAVGLNGKQTVTKFKDVPSSLKSSGYINSAVKRGIISGYTDGTFRPKEIVTRGQMAMFLARAYELKNEAKTNFKDMSPKVSSYKSVRQIVLAEITTGYSDNTYRPNLTLTRGQISAFVSRAMKVSNIEAFRQIDENRAWDYIVKSDQYYGAREDLLFFHFGSPLRLIEVIDSRWPTNKFVNRWLFKDGLIKDQLWYGNRFNDTYTSNPLYGGILFPIKDQRLN